MVRIQPMHDYFSTFRGFGLPLLLCAVFCANNSTAQCNFVDVAAQQNISHSFGTGLLGSGVSFMDFDGDGWDDLTFGTSEGELVEVYRNNQGIFEKITLQGVTSTCESKQITWVDYDNDGDKDLYFSCNGANLTLYRNDGNLSFTDVTSEVGLVSPIGTALGSNWADFDRDGWLDLYATYYGGMRNILYRNVGGTYFENMTNASGSAPNTKPTFCGVVFDYNNDGWEDIYLANDRSTRNDLFKNQGNMTFEDASAASRSDLPMDAMGTTLLDMNRDGYFEVYISNSPLGNALILNNGDGTFTDIAEESGTFFGSVGWGVNTLDFDNDSFWDLYVSGSEIGTEVLSSALYRATSTTSFERMQFEGMAADTMNSLSNAVGDFNNDGRMDIAVSNTAPTYSQLWQNSCTNDFHWIKVKPQGVLSNRDGIGSTIVVYAGGIPLYQHMTAGTSFMAQNTDYLHFGIAENTKVDSLKVEWPSGLEDVMLNPAIDQMHTIIEGSSSTSVPILGYVPGTTLCTGDEVTLSADIYGDGIEIEWSTGETGKSIEVNKNGNYSVTVTKGDQTFQSGTIEISFGRTPEVTVDVNHKIGVRLGSIMIIENNGANSYRWSHDANETSNVATDLTPGFYQVTITGDTGCEITYSFEILEQVVTSLDHPLVAEIEYTVTSDQLLIILPSDLAAHFQEASLLNATGKTIQHLQKVDPENTVLFTEIPKNQLFIVSLGFKEGRVVKKLMVKE